MKKHFVVLMGVAVLATSTSGLVLPVHSAYASDALTPDSQTQEAATSDEAASITVDYPTLVLNRWLSKLDQYTAVAADIDSSDVLNAIANNQSLAAASGLGQSDLVAKLTDFFLQDLAYQVKTGELTQKESTQLQQLATSRINDLVSGSWKKTALTTSIHNNGSEIIHNRLQNIISDTASIATDINSSGLRAALRNGQSLAEATGIDAGTLTDSLTAMLNSDLQAAVTTGGLQADLLDKAEQTGAAAVAQIVREKGYDIATTSWMEKYGQSVLSDKMDWTIQATAIFASKDYSDVVDALSAGQSLVSASGLAYDDLLSQLTSNINQGFETEWQAGNISAKLASQLEQSAAKQLGDAITQNGYGQSIVGSSNKGIAAESIRSIISDSAGYIGSPVGDLEAALGSGKTLVEATNLADDELLGVLQSRVDNYLSRAVQNGWLNASDKDATKQDAYALLNDAIGTRGYKVPVDAKSYLAERLDRIMNDVATVSNIEVADLTKRVAQGQSLAQAAQTDSDSLLYKLLAQANENMNAFVTAGSVSEDDAAAFKTDYASGVSQLLSIND
ncbi:MULTISPECIES: hypothetical protein [unclassified Paenibacillus]|uniref:hypothetical protein n=1 Tax=unclassified Paenibacillus TaxID=185978 RepID=UPI00278870CA|nr:MULTISPECIES: hypothetical protein [unclassified Paenibacillus]MDQ0903146.1 hypothetical protein [Paenibacillus sp. V4I7]MDQ0918378.1 hypothetical protein [Paenibacillus sp. V4I5]